MLNNVGVQMPKSRLKVTRSTPEEIRTLLRKDEKFMIGVRLYAVYQVARGASSRELRQTYNVSFKSVCNWVNGFNKLGLEGLKDKPRSGRKPRLKPKQMEEIKTIITKHSPENYGYNTATWTGPMLIDLIDKKYNIKYQKAQIYNVLGSLGLSYQKGRGIYPEADETKKKEFEEILKKTPGKNKRYSHSV